jgi:hypothetical protein
MTQNVIANSFVLGNSGFPLPNMSYVNANTVVSSSGQNNIYTVPTGRRAIISSINCNSQGTVNAAPAFQNSGTYYNAGGTTSSLTAGTPLNIVLTIPLILDAGEILSIELSGAVSVNVWPQIVEFDANSIVKSGKFLNLASGNNLLYTCPAGKSMCILDKNLNFGGISATAFNVGASGGGTSYYMLVPSGQSPAAGFRITNGVTVTGTANFGQSGQSNSRGPSLGAGDMLYANCTATNNVCAMFNYVEM